MYHLHHCVMHHVGNNRAGADGSSTERYRRDSPAAFLHYWLRFALAAWLEVRAAGHRLLAAGGGPCFLLFGGSCWLPGITVCLACLLCPPPAQC